MSKILVLAEKPSVGKELARVLKCNKVLGGYIEGENYVVTWALGHLVTLAEPEAYGEKYKQWSMETLPMIPANMKLKIIPETAKQFGVVKKLLLSKEISSSYYCHRFRQRRRISCKMDIRKSWISKTNPKALDFFPDR